jgi:two-component system, NtrC family, sensor kinase
VEAGSVMSKRRVLVAGDRPESSVLPMLARGITRRDAIPLSLAIALLLGVGDLVTGIEVPFTLLYLVPIALATWFNGRALGATVAVLCVSIALGVDAYTRIHHGWHLRPLVMAWSHMSMMVLYALGIALLWRLRLFVEKEARERVLTVEQLRHAERLNVIGKLAAGVAHELGTPLNVILGSAEMIESDAASSDGTRQLAHSIQRQTTRMAVIIRQLLDFSRKGGHEQVTTDLGVLAKDVAGLLQTLARKHDTELLVDVGSSDPILVRANRIELEQVLNNLVVNAIQSMPHGGTIRVRCDVRESADNAFASLAVADQGTGIPPEDLVRVFDPFFTTKEVGNGTGLGLSVSYGIVQDHGGTMSVDSRLGVGSEFTVLLPLRR